MQIFSRFFWASGLILWNGSGAGIVSFSVFDFNDRYVVSDKYGGTVANRLRRWTSNQTVLGSNPAVAAALSPWTRLFTPIVPRRSLHISFY